MRNERAANAALFDTANDRAKQRQQQRTAQQQLAIARAILAKRKRA